MVALLLVLLSAAILLGAVMIAVRQMAHAHRRHYQEEVAANDLACALERDIKQKAPRRVQRPRHVTRARKHVRHTHAGQSRSVSVM